MDKEVKTVKTDNSLRQKSADFIAAARVLANLDIENINLRPRALKRKLQADFKLNPKDLKNLVELFAKRETKPEKRL